MSLAFSVAGFVITFKAAQTLVPEYIYSIFCPPTLSLLQMSQVFLSIWEILTRNATRCLQVNFLNLQLNIDSNWEQELSLSFNF